MLVDDMNEKALEKLYEEQLLNQHITLKSDWRDSTYHRAECTGFIKGIKFLLKRKKKVIKSLEKLESRFISDIKDLNWEVERIFIK